MNFYQRLQMETEQERKQLWQHTPLIGRAFNGDISLDEYVAYLAQAYHHVKHTTPFLMATGARVPMEQEWLRTAIAEYIEEEVGHQEWILNDIAACGFDKEKVRHARPNFSTELWIAYAYDTINRVNPLGFFGSVQVLEGTSIQMADSAAERIQQSLGLPDQAFTYLRSHGALDQEHICFFESLMNRITDAGDQQQIIHSARCFYQLYRNILMEVDAGQALSWAA